MAQGLFKKPLHLFIKTSRPFGKTLEAFPKFVWKSWQNNCFHETFLLCIW
jgi:hypothetical protein